MRGRLYATIRRSLVAAAAVFAAATTAEAANLNASPSITLDGSWDSNIRDASVNEVSDYFLRATPRLTLSLATQTATVGLSGGFDAEWYLDNPDLNSTTATKNFDLTTTDPIQVTPTFSVRPSARFVESVDAVRRMELSQAAIPGLPPSESLATVRTKTREYAGSLQFVYRLTPNVDLGFGGGALRREYPDHPPDLFGSRTFTGNLSLSYRVTPRFSSGFFGDTSYDSYDGRPNSRTYSAGLSGNYALSDRFQLEARAGGSLLRESTGIGDERNEEWSPIGRLSLTYASGDFRATLTGSYEFAGGGSLGLPTRRASAVVTFSDRFAPRWTWNLSGSVQSNRSTDEAVTEDLITGEGTGGIRYEAAQWASLHMSGRVFRQLSHGAVANDISRQSVILGITLSDTYNVF